MSVDIEKYQEGQIILLDKSYRWTSFDAVNKIRKSIGVKKVGHAGTLDPLATGLLIICTGRKTKLLQQFQDLKKEYTGTIYLGAIRPSHDKETEITETFPITGITIKKIHNIASSMIGDMDQIPPAYSAIRKDGIRVYELARKGQDVKMAPRKVSLYDFDITEIRLPLVNFRILCSKGFYVRSLASDFGRILGCGGYLDSLRRTAIGDYRIQDAVTIDQFLESGKE